MSHILDIDAFERYEDIEVIERDYFDDPAISAFISHFRFTPPIEIHRKSYKVGQHDLVLTYHDPATGASIETNWTLNQSEYSEVCNEAVNALLQSLEHFLESGHWNQLSEHITDLERSFEILYEHGYLEYIGRHKDALAEIDTLRNEIHDLKLENSELENEIIELRSNVEEYEMEAVTAREEEQEAYEALLNMEEDLGHLSSKMESIYSMLVANFKDDPKKIESILNEFEQELGLPLTIVD